MREYNCPICGRHFVRAPKHLYKDGKRCFCSWTCYLHKDDEANSRNGERSGKYGKKALEYEEEDRI